MSIAHSDTARCPCRKKSETVTYAACCGRHHRGAVAPTPDFYRWSFASMWTPGPFESKPTRAYYYLTDVEASWTPERQEEYLRDYNYPTLWSISIHEVPAVDGKIVTTGEGGMVVTSNPDLAQRLRRLREHGMDRSAFDRHANLSAKCDRNRRRRR